MSKNTTALLAPFSWAAFNEALEQGAGSSPETEGSNFSTDMGDPSALAEERRGRARTVSVEYIPTSQAPHRMNNKRLKLDLLNAIYNRRHRLHKRKNKEGQVDAAPTASIK